MKLYDFKMAPNARRVRIFAAEKGIELETVTVDLAAREQMGDDFKAVNARMAVPTLELDDGTIITESVAICRYLDEIQPEPVLCGEGAKGKAIVEMWHRRCELEGQVACGDAVRNSIEFFKGRAVTGPTNFEQIPALAERGKQRIGWFFEMLDERLGDSPYIAGVDYSIADICALVAIDFAKAAKVRMSEDAVNLQRWYADVSARPSATA